MTCPDEIAEIVLEILETALLRIRVLSCAGRAEQSAIEADHVHNLPRLLADFSSERLAFYWNVERVAYLRQSPEDQRQAWEAYWERLSPHVPVTLAVAPASGKRSTP